MCTWGRGPGAVGAVHHRSSSLGDNKQQTDLCLDFVIVFKFSADSVRFTAGARAATPATLGGKPLDYQDH